MAFVTIVAPRFAVNAPASTDLFSDIVTDLNYLFTNQNSPSVAGDAPSVANGSFEVDASGTIQPTAWNFVAGTGGSGSVVNTQYNDGAQSFQAIQGTVSGNTGGVLTGPYNQSTASNLYYPISPNKAYNLKFMLMCNRADIQNSVVVLWYTNAQSFLGSNVIFSNSTGAAPTSWTVYSYPLAPPVGVYFMQLQFNLGSNATTAPGATGNIYVDGISIKPREPFQLVQIFTSSGTFTVPQGVDKAWVKVSGAPSVNGDTPGGYTEQIWTQMQVGQTIAITISTAGGGTNTAVYSGQTITALNGAGSTAGTASGGAYNLTGGSVVYSANSPFVQVIY